MRKYKCQTSNEVARKICELIGIEQNYDNLYEFETFCQILLGSKLKQKDFNYECETNYSSLIFLIHIEIYEKNYYVGVKKL